MERVKFADLSFGNAPKSSKKPRRPFTDAQALAAKNPDTFTAPTADELARILPGSSVKVCCAGERFWVTVKAVCGEFVTGTVDNALVETRAHGLRLDDVVFFQKRNVYGVY